MRCMMHEYGASNADIIVNTSKDQRGAILREHLMGVF